MIDPITDSDIELLKQKHGDEPLVSLIRRLIVAVDQTLVGSDQREKTNQLLKCLTQQDNIALSSSSWLDWLESVDESQLTWESIQPSINSTNRRKVVQIEDTEPAEDRPRLQPMSKEQMIWAKALDRQANKNSLSNKLLKVAFLLLFLSFGWIFFKYGPLLKEKIYSFKTSSNHHISKKASPLELWGNYQANLYDSNLLQSSLKTLPSKFFDAIETQNLPLLVRDWLTKKQTNPSLTSIDLPSLYWLGLRELEHRFFGLQVEINDLGPWNNLTPGNRHWTFIRKINQNIIYSGDFVESFTKTAQGWDIQIKKLIKKSGIAHRIIIDTKGLYAWSWRMMWQGVSIEGKVVRTENEIFKISSSNAWSEQIEFQIDLSEINIIPAIWSPSFFECKPASMLFPISGQICHGNLFWGDNQVFPNAQGFVLKSTREDWTEHWALNK